MAEKANMAVPNNFSLIIDDTFLLLIYDLFRYGYFMNKGLILRNFSSQISKKPSQSLCFKINSKQEIENDFC